METRQASSPLSACSSAHWKYDVFLSFRGEDTRKSFMDHFYTALHQKGINSFKDDKNIEKGEVIFQELLQAIEDSRIVVIVFSKDYASSTWCLEELSKTYECMKARRQLVMPVFYGVNPSEVRKQTGRYGEAFAKHEQAFSERKEMLERWRNAMREVANLSGWDLKERHESDAIQEIVEEIFRNLSRGFSSLQSDLVGIDSRLEQLSSLLCVGLDDVHILGICGMGGIGKTTLTRVVFETLSSQFDGSSFLSNVREVHEKHGLVSLQEQLLDDILMARNMTIRNAYHGMELISQRLHHRKVLVILDDVNQLAQLELLAGSPNWFGPGSRIIITTRDEHLLLKYRVNNKTYEVEGLSHEESIQLFCLKAFNSKHPVEGYLELSDQVVSYANGLPLALEVLGSFLRGRSVKEWQSALSRLKETPNRCIMDKLQISFYGLEEIEKKIFLDIACFFKGMDKDYVTMILESCGFYPDIGISVLREKSLITISSENFVSMHDLLQEMGREIVRQQSPQEPGNRSRLWLYKDVSHVLENDTGSDEVEGIVLDSALTQVGCLRAKAFQRMNKIRLLKMPNVQLSDGPEYLSNELRALELHKYPSKSLPATFQPIYLVELILLNSSIQQLVWGETKSFPNLKFIDLSHSKNLTKITGFKGFPNLEKLNLEGCVRLFEIPTSIGVLRSLVVLNLKFCKNLKGLPGSICDVKSLKIINLYGCIKLDKLPDNLGNLTSLVEFDVGETGIRELPSSFFLLPDLKVLSLQRWKGSVPGTKKFSLFPVMSRQSMNPMSLMLHSLSSFCSLKKLDVSYCNLKEGAIPNDLSCFASLERLHLSGNDFVSIPASIAQISRLEYLRLDNCKRLQSLPDLPESLEYLFTDGCISMATLPNLCDGNPSKPLWLSLTNCSNLKPCGDNMAISWLKCRLSMWLKGSSQGNLHQEPTLFSMSLPGSEIPRWFNHKSAGTSLKVKLPQGWFDKDKLFGFAACAIFGREPKSTVELSTATPTGNDAPDVVIVELLANILDLFCVCHRVTETRLTSDQLLLIYIPTFLFSSKRSEDWWNTRCSEIEAKFCPKGVRVTVKKCGFRMVHREDIEDPMQ